MSKYELIGAQELVYGDGDDDLEDILGAYELIGRRKHHRQAARRGFGGTPLQQAAAMKMANSGVVVKQQEPTKARKLYMPVPRTLVNAGTSTTLTARPQSIAFKPKRIIVPATIAPDFTIDSILVGVKPQAVQSGSISAETFVQNAVDVDLDCDTVQTSQDFAVAVTNVSGANRTFSATVIGLTAD